MIRLIKTRDYDDMSRKAADIITAQIILKPDSVLGLATGSTPIGLYDILVSRYESGDLDFSGITSVNLDEYKGIQKTNEQSYDYFMRQHLLGRVNIDPANTYLPNGEETDSIKACEEYNQILHTVGQIDIQLLGIGHDGHIGFNEPSDCFSKETHCVDLTAQTINANKRFFASEEDVPKQAYTMGVQTIMSAKRILMVVSGADKAEILYQACCGPITPQVPASILQLHSNAIIVADQQALRCFS